ncbi:hypothetical protein Tco_0954548 [Tanacetum coccineum]|uniref:Reverse transcriptase domain-containing protein n=1 Tax=Tanacetum coccineum TaxID=301880 RepID=A0ABQ5E4P7_9ASTR
MRTRSQSRNLNRQQQQAPPAFVEPFNLEEPIENPAPPVVTMDDTRTMAQLLEAPTEGYEDAIVVPSLALLDYNDEDETGLWMRKDGENKPFTKIYTVKDEGRSLYYGVLGLRKNGEVVLEEGLL